jgi:pimeloyl-ACP methyl ester carboxylesterase
MFRGYARTSQGQVHYQSAGDGAPLVMLHATPRSSRIFERIIHLLSKRFRVIAFDTPGFGASDPLPATFSIESLAQTFVEAMDDLGVPKAHLLGYHTGNKIAAAAASGHGDRVDALVLVGMSHSLVVERSRREAAIHALVDGALDQSGRAASERLRRWAATFADVAQTWWKPDIIGRDALTEDDLQELEREVLDKIQARRSVDAIYRANFDFDFQAALAKVRAPTLVIELATRQEAHLKGSGCGIAGLVPRAEWHVLDDSDRTVWEREPARISQAVAAFVERARVAHRA